MTFNMTVPMVAWMHHRGHAWSRCAEMGGAMFVLGFALLVPFSLGMISSDVVLPLEMNLMIPVMMLVMLFRLDEYTGHAHAPLGRVKPRGDTDCPGRNHFGGARG
jgi:hypothetical protein